MNWKKRFFEDRGFSLTELVIASALLMIIAPMAIGLINASIKSQQYSQANLETHTLQSNMSAVFTKDIEKGMAASIRDDGTTVMIEEAPNKCITWKVDTTKGEISRQYKTTSLNQRYVISDKISLNGNTPPFSMNISQNYLYNFVFNKDSSYSTVIQGTAMQKNQNLYSGTCWDKQG